MARWWLGHPSWSTLPRTLRLWLESAFMKWFWIAVLIVIGIVAVVFAVEYLTHPISQLPSWVPGTKHGELNSLGKPVRGHEYKRGYLAAFVAVVAFAWA